MTAVMITTMLVAANVLGAGMAYPQAARLARTRDVDGVSGVWAGVSIAMNIWWLAYGLANDLWGLVPVSAVSAALYGVIAVTLLRAVGVRALTSLGFGAFGLGLVPLPFLIIGGWSVAGVAIGLCYGLQLAPAVIAAFRTRDLSGVAPATWMIAWAEAAIWLVYGLITVDVALLSGGGSGLLMASIILTRLVATGHRVVSKRRPAWALA